MSNFNQNVIRHKIGLLNLATCLDNSTLQGGLMITVHQFESHPIRPYPCPLLMAVCYYDEF